MQIKKHRRLLVGAVAGVVVLGGAALALPAFAETGGTIAGHLTDAGAPVPYASVILWDSAYNYVANTSTTPDGAFQLGGLTPGSYKLEFNANGFDQWSVQKADFEHANPITVTDGATTTVEEVVRPTGSIAGTVTGPDGSPASYVQVSAYALGGGSGYGYGYTDAAGHYTVSRLLPGDYRVSFYFNGLQQYANNTTDGAAAAAITVAAGATTTLDQQQLPVAEVSGTVLTAAGGQAAGVSVSFNELAGGGYGYATTDLSGHYSVSLWPGTYTVTVRQGTLEQYVPGAVLYSQAGRYTFGVGSNTLDETLLATGTVSGTLTHSDGTPVAGASVNISGPVYTNTSTDSSGFYSAPVFPGSYKVEFQTPYGTQWAHGKTTRSAADPITVAAGQTTTVDDALPPSGSVTVTAVDSVTNAPVQEFCVDNLGDYACTTTGSITVDDLLPGARTFYLHPDWGSESEYLYTTATVTVVSGVTTPVTVTMARGGTVTVTMTDHQSHAPVAHVCLVLVNTQLPGLFSYGDAGGQRCSDAAGHATATQVTPGTYKALAWSLDGVHGHQWVGQTNGVGEWEKAVTITVTAGGTTTMAPIRLDGKGAVAGTITDEVTGQPLENAAVTLTPFTTDRSGGEALGVSYTDAAGHYTYSDLGPYQWSFYYSNNANVSAYAGEWTGDKADRDKAGHIKIKEGRTADYDVELGKGVTLNMHVLQGGAVVDAGIVYAYDSSTGAVLAEYELTPADLLGAFKLQVKGPQQVKFRVALFYPEGDVWAGGTSFANAHVYNVPAGGSVQLDITV